MNYAVFTSEILDEPERACEFSKVAYSTAIRDIHQNDASAKPVAISKHSNLLLQLLLDDIQLWKELHHDNANSKHAQDRYTHTDAPLMKTTAPSSPVQRKSTNAHFHDESTNKEEN